MALSHNMFGQVPEMDVSKLDPETGLEIGGSLDLDALSNEIGEKVTSFEDVPNTDDGTLVLTFEDGRKERGDWVGGRWYPWDEENEGSLQESEFNRNTVDDFYKRLEDTGFVIDTSGTQPILKWIKRGPVDQNAKIQAKTLFSAIWDMLGEDTGLKEGGEIA